MHLVAANHRPPRHSGRPRQHVARRRDAEVGGCSGGTAPAACPRAPVRRTTDAGRTGRLARTEAPRGSRPQPWEEVAPTRNGSESEGRGIHGAVQARVFRQSVAGEMVHGPPGLPLRPGSPSPALPPRGKGSSFLHTMSSHFDGQNAAYVQALYEDFTRNPDAVHPEWREFFRTRRDELREAGLLVVDGRPSAPAAPTPAAAPSKAPHPPPAPPCSLPRLRRWSASPMRPYRWRSR